MKVYVTGYIKKNLGDDLFFKLLFERYPEVDFLISKDASYLGEIDNLTYYKPKRNTSFIEKVIYKILNVISNGRYNYEYKIINSCDAAIKIGGSLFIENKYNSKYKNFTKISVPYFIIGSNFGPWKNDFFYKKCLDLFKNSSGVSFRDMYSYELFKDDVKCQVAPDLIFSMAKGYEKIDSGDKKVVISIIDCYNRFDNNIASNYERTISTLIENLQKKNYSVTLISFCKAEGDEAAIERIYSELKSTNGVNKYYYDGNIMEALNIIKSCDSIFASRFHANILGLVFGKNVIPLIYSDKTINMLNDIGFSGKKYDIRKNDFSELSNFDIDSKRYIYNLDDIPTKSIEHFKFFDLWLKNNK